MDLELAGKTAIISGGSRGIGKAIARQLAQEGVDLALLARDRAALETTAQEITAETGRKVVTLVADTTDDASVKQAVDEAVQQLGHLDILVNAAAQPGGQTPPPKFAEITDELFWDDLNVKVLGYFRVARHVAPHMIKQGWGRIINISGLGARKTGSLIGATRNVAVSAMTKNMADELGKHGINVTVVHPATTRTEKTPGVISARAKAQGVSEADVEKRMNSGNVIGRLVDMQEVAYVVTFLASPKAVAITGDAIAVGGGDPGSIYY